MIKKQILTVLAIASIAHVANALEIKSGLFLENNSRKEVSKFEPSKSDREDRFFTPNCILANKAVIKLSGVISTGEIVAELIDSGAVPNPTRECFERQSRAIVLSLQQVQEMRDITKEIQASRGEELARDARARARASEIRRLLERNAI